jgi:hypothetical protein
MEEDKVILHDCRLKDTVMLCGERPEVKDKWRQGPPDTRGKVDLTSRVKSSSGAGTFDGL